MTPSEDSSKSVIVTGGAGFIGSHLVDALLESGHRVTVIDDLSSGLSSRVDPRAELCELDIVDGTRLRKVIERSAPSAIYHLAAQASVVVSVEDPTRDCQVNVQGTLGVVDAASSLGTPVVFTSTGGALYGDKAPRPTPESYIPEPLSPYGASKLAGEAYVRTWSDFSGVPHAVCRLGNVYGPRQSPHGEAGVVAIFAHHLHTGKAPKIYGHGTPTRDYVYVGDVVRALLAATGRKGTFNIATSAGTEVSTVWEVLRESAGSEVAPQMADLRPGELQNSRLDASHALQELGWHAEVSIEEGLRTTYSALVEEFEQAAV